MVSAILMLAQSPEPASDESGDNAVAQDAETPRRGPRVTIIRSPHRGDVELRSERFGARAPSDMDRRRPVDATALPPPGSAAVDEPGVQPPDRTGPTRPKRPDASTDGWAIQVGAFSTPAGAQTAIEAAIDAADGRLTFFDSRVALVDAPQGALYRARFSGLSERDARLLCADLRGAGLECVVAAP